MKTVHVCKAASLLGGALSPEVEPATLVVDGDVEKVRPRSVPMEPGWEKASSAFYRAEAERIVEVLDQLPQGTRHALLVVLLERAPIHYMGRVAT